MKRMLMFCLVALSAYFAPVFAQDAPDPLDVLPAEDFFFDQSIMLLKHLQRIPQERSWQRDVEVARITNEQDWTSYRNRLLEDYRDALGLPFPERNDLEAERTGIIDRGSYRIEKIIYRSQPGVAVTSNLYVPQTGGGPFPGIIFPCGHWHVGKAADEYHSAALGLVSKGYVVLVYDPVGQGERCDYFKPDGSLVTEEPVIEHTLLANPLFLMGKHLMTLFIWDAIRGIDYLISRPEVDPERIGITGNSGGGTVTLHLVPLEPRVRVAVPDGTVNHPKFNLGMGGISDGEQNLPKRLPHGITHADLMMLAWPRPYRLIHESRGGVSLGARESYVQARWLYETLGSPEKMSLVETEWPHGFFKFSREKMYQWFDRWFYGREDNWEEPELNLEKQEELWCTKSGRMVLESGKSIQKYIDEQAEAVLPVREAPKKGASFDSFRADIVRGARKVLNNPTAEAPPRMVPMGETEVDGVKVEKLALYSEEDVYLPVLSFKPPSRDKYPLVVLADSRGKAADRGALAVSLAKAGVGVLAVDLRGWGETEVTRRSERDRMGGLMAQTLGMEASMAYDGLYLGRSIFAMRVHDLQRTIEFARSLPQSIPGAVAVAGRGAAGVAALYAAALDGKLAGVMLDSALVSWRELTRPGLYTWNFIDFLPGALAEHDLPQLAAACAPAPLRVLNALDARRELLPSAGTETAYEFAARTYRSLGAGKAFAVETADDVAGSRAAWLRWARQVFRL